MLDRNPGKKIAGLKHALPRTWHRRPCRPIAAIRRNTKWSIASCVTSRNSRPTAASSPVRRSRADHREWHQDRARGRHLGSGACVLQQARAGGRGGRLPTSEANMRAIFAELDAELEEATRNRRLQSEDLRQARGSVRRHQCRASRSVPNSPTARSCSKTVSQLSHFCKGNLVLTNHDTPRLCLRPRRRNRPRSPAAADAPRSTLPHLAHAWPGSWQSVTFWTLFRGTWLATFIVAALDWNSTPLLDWTRFIPGIPLGLIRSHRHRLRLFRYRASATPIAVPTAS